MQERGGAKTDHIVYLFKENGLPIHRQYTFTNKDDLYTFLLKAPKLDENLVGLPFAYGTSSEMNHMVVLFVRRDRQTRQVNGRLIDYQLPKRDPRRHIKDIPNSSAYFIFDTVGLYK